MSTRQIYFHRQIDAPKSGAHASTLLLYASIDTNRRTDLFRGEVRVKLKQNCNHPVNPEATINSPSGMEVHSNNMWIESIGARIDKQNLVVVVEGRRHHQMSSTNHTVVEPSSFGDNANLFVVLTLPPEYDFDSNGEAIPPELKKYYPNCHGSDIDICRLRLSALNDPLNAQKALLEWRETVQHPSHCNDVVLSTEWCIGR